METARNIPVLPFPCLIVFYSTKIIFDNVDKARLT